MDKSISGWKNLDQNGGLRKTPDVSRYKRSLQMTQNTSQAGPVRKEVGNYFAQGRGVGVGVGVLELGCADWDFGTRVQGSGLRVRSVV